MPNSNMSENKENTDNNLNQNLDNSEQNDNQTETEFDLDSILNQINSNENNLDLKSLIDNVMGEEENRSKSNPKKLDKNVKKIMKKQSKMSDEKKKTPLLKKIWNLILTFIVVTWVLGVTLLIIYIISPPTFEEIKENAVNILEKVKTIFEK